MSGIAGRKAIVLLTYGEDTCSRLVGGDKVLARIEEFGIPIYIVQYEARSCPKSSTDFLVRLASESGGRYFRANSIRNIEEALSRIADDLQGHYTICYYPSNPSNIVGYRQIKVNVDRPEVKIRARTGYRVNF
ncbi:MAG TPA: hypothetical protein VE398_16855 [Acidobacteriota bacterium]|nr:hypothetical protein [Acidobacteriota bacterium]